MWYTGAKTTTGLLKRRSTAFSQVSHCQRAKAAFPVFPHAGFPHNSSSDTGSVPYNQSFTSHTHVGISSPRWRQLPEPKRLSEGALLSTVPQQGGITRRKLQFNLPGAGILKRDFLGMEMYPLGLVWSRFQRMSLATRRQVQGIRLLTMVLRIIKDCFPFQLQKQMILRLKGTQFLS